MIKTLPCGDKSLDLQIPQIMGILNVTPDSFSDGGLFVSVDAALQQSRNMIAAGATIIDVGGESTRPNAATVPTQQELNRVIPIIEALRKEFPDIIISIDSSKPDVMLHAMVAGANFINDVNALQAEGAMAVAREHNAAVCLMHMQGRPRTMQQAPHYQDVVSEVLVFLQHRVSQCTEYGINQDNIVIDPGFGFGKTLPQNLLLVKHLERFVDLGLPLLVGFSRKSMIDRVIDKPVDERVYASVALATIACFKGANIIRVHDVSETIDAVKLCHAVRDA
ncbi:MAG: dihydropteroate synthase [Gammaproteobacteria bacterium]|nr:dihydropteroate synthase [Gammaproteobacteria bacterium]